MAGAPSSLREFDAPPTCTGVDLERLVADVKRANVALGGLVLLPRELPGELAGCPLRQNTPTPSVTGYCGPARMGRRLRTTGSLGPTSVEEAVPPECPVAGVLQSGCCGEGSASPVAMR